MPFACAILFLSSAGYVAGFVASDEVDINHENTWLAKDCESPGVQMACIDFGRGAVRDESP